MSKRPILLVHGIWDRGERFRPMTRALTHAGLGPVHAIDLLPNDGRAPIENLASQVVARVLSIASESDDRRVDIVGFSMGALVTRYALQRLSLKGYVRRFVSIAGPHSGTWTAYALPHPGVAQMRPESALIRDLERDDDPFASVEVHCFWTPYDLMILPARSARLKRAHFEEPFAVKLHRWMIRDPRVLAALVAALERE